MQLPAQGEAGSSVRCPNTSKQRTLWLSGKESDDVAAKSGPGTQPEKVCVSAASCALWSGVGALAQTAVAPKD